MTLQRARGGARARRRGAVVVAVSSGEVYGPPERCRSTSRAPLRPQNPYAVSKAARRPARAASTPTPTACASSARAPSTTPGPGQEPIYAIASFARQVAAGARARARTRSASSPATRTRAATTPTSATSSRAYRLLAERGEPGDYNVCSGRTASAARARRGARRGRRRRRRPRRRSRARARARGHGGPRLARHAARRHRLGARDPARADARRHRRVVARGDPRGPRARAYARIERSFGWACTSK